MLKYSASDFAAWIFGSFCKISGNDVLVSFAITARSSRLLKVLQRVLACPDRSNGVAGCEVEALFDDLVDDIQLSRVFCCGDDIFSYFTSYFLWIARR